MFCAYVSKVNCENCASCCVPHLCPGSHKSGTTESHRSNQRVEDGSAGVSGGHHQQSGASLKLKLAHKHFHFCKGTLLQLLLERQRVIKWHVSHFLSPQWQENPGLLESQVQSVAMAQQATLEMEFKRREAVYRDVLNRQQSVRTRNLETRVFGHIQDQNNKVNTSVFVY